MNKFIIVVLALISSCSATLSAKPETASKVSTTDLQRMPKGVETHLFMDWSDIEKGRLVAIYDVNRLTEEAKTNFANSKKEWGIDSRIGQHGTASYHMPQGIRISIEKAKKTERWLVADQLWEEDISGGNVIYEDGMFRCWYSATMPKQKVGIVYIEEGRGMETNGTSTCYAENKDGIHGRPQTPSL
ncbi:MAG: hypothetical protein ABIP71_02230 [Verrucomicrobiota bacterium]